MSSRTSAAAKKAVPNIRERQFKHILESCLDRGYSLDDAVEIAARTVNKYRAKLSRKKQGPRLVTKGGSRRQWWPGKKVPKKKWYCLTHRKRFKNKGAMRAHYLAHRRPGSKWAVRPWQVGAGKKRKARKTTTKTRARRK